MSWPVLALFALVVTVAGSALWYLLRSSDVKVSTRVSALRAFAEQPVIIDGAERQIAPPRRVG